MSQPHGQSFLNRMAALALVLIAGLALLIGTPHAALAGPVSWHEVAPTAAGRQWWDEGSLRISKTGLLTVLSRFQPAPDPNATSAADAGTRPQRLGDLYVMEIDCGQDLFRDTSVNGLPRWGADWQPVGGDGLIEATVHESCQAAGLLPTA